MEDIDRFRLRFGPYKTPRFHYGEIVQDSARGEVTIVGLSDGKIPWPIGKKGRAKSLVVYRDLRRAIETESNQAVCYWWGLTPQTISKWRKILGVDVTNAGTLALRRDHITPERKSQLTEAATAVAANPDRRERIRQSKLGVQRPKHVLEKLRMSRIGRTWTADMRQKRLQAQERRHPRNYVPWTAEEDMLVRTRTITEVMAITGRSRNRIEIRRRELGLVVPRN